MQTMKRILGLPGLLVLALALWSTAPSHVQAQLTVDITKGFVEPLPIAISDFYADGNEGSEVGSDIAQVINDNLEGSGLFAPIDQRAFIQDPAALDAGPRFADWRMIDAEALVSGKVDMQNDGRMRVEFRLWDVLAEEQMQGLAYTTAPDNWRRIAHIISDEIYERLTGESGYFDTRIVYVAESGPQDRRVKRLAIMDQDGANHRFLTDGSSLVLTPRFSPTSQEITFMSYAGGAPRVHLLNLNTGQQEVLGEFPGMTFSPRFSPDGNKVILSMAEDGNSDIYTMDLRTRDMERLTDHPSIDTSPSYSPDGDRIVFNSDRSGQQQLYVMNADGSNVQRISFGDGRYATPVWSPRGDLIAFTRMSQGNFYVGVMKPDGSGERMISQGFLVEGPTWAPNGRVLAFFRQEPADSSGRVSSELVSVDVTGFNERVLPTPMDASDPAWSPLLTQPGTP
ncbi:Tol-Pal system beta propeller repeat protein TolB [Fodinicurvata halophila]|uniref:Tol-Pal system protein TolB n=1 Tax=Fodinicurvata halophila TaxID=1419723 RepID=A0ABV8UI53_9PROT